jgi:hypothetical protein
MEKDTRIDLAYIPIRPLEAGKKEITIGDMCDVVDIHNQLKAEKSVAINWAGFSYVTVIRAQLESSEANDSPKAYQAMLAYDKGAGEEEGAVEFTL